MLLLNVHQDVAEKPLQRAAADRAGAAVVEQLALVVEQPGGRVAGLAEGEVATRGLALEELLDGGLQGEGGERAGRGGQGGRREMG